MRLAGVALLFVLGACSVGPGSSATSTPTPPITPIPTPQATCRLPVWWPENATATSVDIHAAFVSIPDGAVTDAGVLPQLSTSLPGLASVASYGATYESASNQWVHVDRAYLSPDGKRFAYWTSTGSNDNSVHVVDLATGVDHVLYSGSTLFIVIAFAPEGIYLVHGVAPRQGAFEKLYLLDPAGGAPTLVNGSDRHMYQWGWVLVSDGAAWGIDNRTQGSDYFYSIMRLDLVTGQVVKWFESPFADFIWPLGTDLQHRLYVQGVNGGELWRVTAAGESVQLPNPGPINLADYMGVPSAFVADSQGAWMTGTQGVWLYGDSGAPKHFVIGPSGATPAGPCLAPAP